MGKILFAFYTPCTPKIESSRDPCTMPCAPLSARILRNSCSLLPPINKCKCVCAGRHSGANNLPQICRTERSDSFVSQRVFCSPIRQQPSSLRQCFGLGWPFAMVLSLKRLRPAPNYRRTSPPPQSRFHAPSFAESPSPVQSLHPGQLSRPPDADRRWPRQTHSV